MKKRLYEKPMAERSDLRIEAGFAVSEGFSTEQIDETEGEW